MEFPNVEVQEHWLAVLERAVTMMSEVRWVCAAVRANVDPSIEQEVQAAIEKAIAPYITVNTWRLAETGTLVQSVHSAHEYRTAWLGYMVEQCRAMQKRLGA